MLGKIYIITNKINGKQYIGQTIQPLKKRFDRHCQYYGSTAESKMVIKLAIHKYGRSNFNIELLEECDESLLDEREVYYINKYDTYNNGYNSTTGGQFSKRKPKLEKEIQLNICSLYEEGFSLRNLALEFNVDKQTIKNILLLNNIKLRTTRTYKLSQIYRQHIIDDFNSGISKVEILKRYKISRSYLSQLLTAKRRI